MIELTPGSAQSAFKLLSLIEVQGLTPQAVVHSFKRVDRMPAHAVLEFVQTLNWAAVEGDGLLVLSSAGEKILREHSYAAQARRTLLDYARIISPAWLQNAPFGRLRVLRFAAGGTYQLMVEAEVADAIDDTVVAFWDELSSLARQARQEDLSSIGRHGERLTLAHETRRTGRAARWVAIDSNTDGYDVLSVRDAADTSALTIEVKTSTIGLRGVLHLTRSEWDLAREAEAHVFHLWDVSDASEPRLAVVDVSAMAGHVPEDQGRGAWELVRVPFGAFSGRFDASAF